MWATVNVLELVAREFGDNDATLVNVIQNIEERDADIAGKDGAWQQVMYEAGSCALSFGSFHFLAFEQQLPTHLKLKRQLFILLNTARPKSRI